jgi:FlaA1/EpsC-like NDP-sugar epimerase
MITISATSDSQPQSYPRGAFLFWSTLSSMAILAMTSAMPNRLRRFFTNGFWSRRAVIAGYNAASLEFAHRLRANTDARLEVKGFFDDRSRGRLGMEPDVECIGSLSDVGIYVRRHRVNIIYIALPNRHTKRFTNLLHDLCDTPASICYIPDTPMFHRTPARFVEVHGLPLVTVSRMTSCEYRNVAKRLTDIGFSLMIILALPPLFALIAISVKSYSAGHRLKTEYRLARSASTRTTVKNRIESVGNQRG